MKFKQCIPLILLALMPWLVSAQGDTLWTRHFGTDAADGCYGSCTANDGGLILAGYSCGSPQGDGKPDGFLVHIDAWGNSLWQTMFDDTGWEAFYDVTPLHDQTGYLCTGYILRGDSTQMDLLVVITDNQGMAQTVKTYGGTGVDMGYSVEQTPDGHYIILGSTTSYGHGEDDFYLLKVDGMGDTLWTRALGCEGSDVGYDCVVTEAGDYYLAGSSGIYDSPGVSSGNNRDFFVFKTDENGNVLDSANYYIMGSGQGEFDAAYSICALNDGNFCITGGCSKEGTEAMNVGVLKIDPGLNELWKKRFEPGTFYDFGYAVGAATADSGIMISGSLNHATTGHTDGFVMKLGPEGNMIWKNILETNGYGALRTLVDAGDGAFIVSGYLNDLNHVSYDCWSARIEDLQVSSGHLNPPADFDIWVYPNPCHGDFRIEYAIDSPQNILARLYTVQGRLVESQSVFHETSGKKTMIFPVNNVCAGSYILRIKNRITSSTRSLVINQ